MIDKGGARDTPRTWTVRQIIDDPNGDHDFAIVATVDLDAPTRPASRSSGPSRSPAHAGFAS
jgi:hypothetical protein